jgi:hemerythrin-like domain-containing protein
MTTPQTPLDTDAPLDSFAQCHTGILTHLDQLAELPALLAPAAQARRIASDLLGFFRQSVFEHHAEEERELFPAVLASAHAGDEHQQVLQITQRLSQEHRQVEQAWHQIEAALKLVAKGEDSPLDTQAVVALVKQYRAHAQYEEQVFLPLSHTILSRNGNHMAALGLSLHLRHVLPEVLSRFSSRV